MKRGNGVPVMMAVAVAMVAGATARPALAIKQFNDEFKAVYVKPDSSDPAEKALAAAVETAKCNLCHKGKEKKDRNAYGEALAELLDKKEDAKNVDKIRKALETVAAKASPDGGPTFGELIKAGKLPGGAPE
jgi:hypothetical protein